MNVVVYVPAHVERALRAADVDPKLWVRELVKRAMLDLVAPPRGAETDAEGSALPAERSSPASEYVPVPSTLTVSEAIEPREPRAPKEPWPRVAPEDKRSYQPDPKPAAKPKPKGRR